CPPSPARGGVPEGAGDPGRRSAAGPSPGRGGVAEGRGEVRDRAFTLVTLAAFVLLVMPPLLWLLGAAVESPARWGMPEPRAWRRLCLSVGVAAGRWAAARAC